MSTFTATSKNSIAAIAEVDFVFSGGSDFLFSDGTDFVFLEGVSGLTSATKTSSTFTAGSSTGATFTSESKN